MGTPKRTAPVPTSGLSDFVPHVDESAFSETQRALLAKYRGGPVRVGIVGMGYVGLPLALAFAESGVSVAGIDVDPSKVAMLGRGESYLSTVRPERVKAALGSGRFACFATHAAVADCDAILLCVPTPLGEGRSPDMSYIEGSCRSIMPHLRPHQLVVLESSTYPGTTEEVCLPILEQSGLKAGGNLHLAFSPEREDPGNKEFSTRKIAKLVGGLDDFSGLLAEALYWRALEQVIRVSHARVAEAAKLTENIYRSVNIALVNELKVVYEALGIDVWEVIAAAATKPFGYQAFWPGPGLGGHCIPIDPFYLTWKAASAGVPTRFIELAGEINSAMPDRVIHRVQDVLNDHGKPLRGSKILMLGVAYKADVSDTRESPGVELFEKLGDKGAVVTYHDPMVTILGPTRKFPRQVTGIRLTAEAVRDADVVLMVTNHSGVDLKLVATNARVIVDTRNAFAGFPKANVVKA